MTSSGARVPRRVGVAHVGKDDLKVVLILLDGSEWCPCSQKARRGARVPRRLGVAHVGKDDLKVVLILLDGWEGCTWVR